MELWLSLDKDFEEHFKYLKTNYKEFLRIDGLTNDKLDPTRFFKSFLESNNVANVSIDDNSNVNSQNIPTLLGESHKPLQKLLSYNKIFIEMKEEFGLNTAKEFLTKQTLGEIYQHNGNMNSFQSYCFAYDVKSIAERGLFFIDEMKANPPKHMDTFSSHLLEFISWATNQQSGATGVPSALLWLYYFWQKDKKEGYHGITDFEAYKKQEFQKLIYALNQTWLKQQQQSAYTNFSIFDRAYYEGLFGGDTFPDSSYMIDHIENYMQFQKDFLDFIKKEREFKSWTFPVLTFSAIFKEGKWQDEDMAKYVVNHNMKWADINMYSSDNPDILSSCCRMNFDTNALKPKKLEGRFSSISGADLNIGSSEIVTLNLPRIAFIGKGDFDKTKEIIKKDVDLIQKYHFVHRKILKKNISRGLLPVYSSGLMNMDKQFVTVGVTGVEEYLDILGGLDVNKINEKEYNDLGRKYAVETLDYINKLGEITVDKYKFTQNIEQIPNTLNLGM